MVMSGREWVGDSDMNTSEGEEPSMSYEEWGDGDEEDDGCRTDGDIHEAIDEERARIVARLRARATSEQVTADRHIGSDNEMRVAGLHRSIANVLLEEALAIERSGTCTGRERDMSKETPVMQKVRAIDVEPYKWALWCSVGGSKPYANDICSRKWSDDGQRIWFMLDSHNFLNASPDEELELVPIVRKYARADGTAAFVAKRPTPTVPCAMCAGSGRVKASP